MPSFGGEVKPSVPFRRFAACKRSLNLRGSRNSGKITTGQLSRPQFHLSLLGISRHCGRRHMTAKVGTSKGGGKQWQTTPKNLPRMQCARAVTVTWLGSGYCQARPLRLNTNEWISREMLPAISAGDGSFPVISADFNIIFLWKVAIFQSVLGTKMPA